VTKPIKIVNDPNNPEPPEVMARAIVEIAEGARKLLSSRLNKRAVLVLLKDATRESMETIERVLNAASSLDRTYLKAIALQLVAVAMSAALGACAHAPAKPVAAPSPVAAAAPRQARCNEAPQWTTVDDKGQRVGIYVCFGSDSQLLWTARVLPPEPQVATSVKKAKRSARRVAGRKP
jgi:hypothetical protein